MAIIITRKDCTLSEANAFYRVEASNLSFVPTSTTYMLALSTTRYINFTPANAGTFAGAGFVIYATVAGDMSFVCNLQEGQTATLAVASPGVVGLVAHGFAVGTAVQFTTAGTLPTGVVANTVYYARNTDCATPADQFHLYSTQAYAIAGGATGRINFTGASSGTHTCWVVRSTQTKTFETIRGGFTSPINTTYDKQGMYIVNMNSFDVAQAITAIAGCWRFRIYQTGTTGTLNAWTGANATTPSYFMYSTTQLSFANGDTPIFAHYCEIDQTANFNGVLGTGDTAYSTAAVICSSEDGTVANTCFLKCTAPAASYTLTLNGKVIHSGHGGFQAGTSATPIPIANRLIINHGAGTVGTARGGFWCPLSSGSASYYFSSRGSIMCYGAYPAKIRTTLAADTVSVSGNTGKTVTMTIANPCVVSLASHGYVEDDPIIFTTTGSLPTGGTTTIVPGTTYYVVYVNTSTFRLSTTPAGAALSTAGGTQSGTHLIGNKVSITVAEDMSAQGWGNGDLIAIGKQDVQGVGSVVPLKIESIAGTTINLTSTIPGYNRLSGATVFNIEPSKYGINLVDTGTNTSTSILTLAFNNLNIEGCYIKGVNMTGVSPRYYDDDANANLQENTFKNSVCENNGTAAGSFYAFYNMRMPRLGLNITNVWGRTCLPSYGSYSSYATSLYKSGTFTMDNVGLLNRGNYNMGITAKTKCLFSNIFMENGTTTASFAFLANLGAGSVLDGLYVWGDTVAASTSYGAFGITAASINSTIKNVTIANCYIGFNISSAAVAFGLKFENVVMSGNTLYDITIFDGAYMSATFKNCNGIISRSYADLTGTTDGTSFNFVNYDDVTNADFVETTYGIFTRCGDSLTDTTVHTAGANKFCIRFQPQLSGTPLEWKFKIPTGDISTKDMTLAVWIKINSAAYYSGTYTLPRITVNYDDGASTTYAQATATTSWQLVPVTFTPATSFGEIEVSLSADTDQAGSDAYVYFDDFSTFYPAGVTLALGGFDLFSNAMPITPPISTGVNAMDVWAVQKSTQTTAGTMGKTLVDVDKKTGLIPALL